MSKSKDIRPLTLECQCGNKKRNLFRTTTYITTEEDYEDEPGTVYIFIKCIKCSSNYEIKEITEFSGKLVKNDY